MLRRVTLSQILDSDLNSFNLVRFLAAISVLVSHSFSIQTGIASSEPLAVATPFSLGQHAVNGFFVLSGLTLTYSLERNPDLIRYAWSRFLRIVPALFAYGLLLAFVAGPLLTSLRWIDYFSDAHTWLYPFAVLVEFARAVPPHEVFPHGPFAEAANNPLWTIKYEIAAYVGLAALAYLGLIRRPLPILGALALTLVVFLLAPRSSEPDGSSWFYQLGRYGFCFLLGCLACRLRDRLPLSPIFLILSAILVVICGSTRLVEAAYVVLVAHLVLVAGTQNYDLLTKTSRRSDISYGTYVYGWPVQQTLVTLFPGLHAMSLLGMSLAIVPLFAIASWQLVEKPALSLKRWDIGNFLAQVRSPS